MIYLNNILQEKVFQQVWMKQGKTKPQRTEEQPSKEGGFQIYFQNEYPT